MRQQKRLAFACHMLARYDTVVVPPQVVDAAVESYFRRLSVGIASPALDQQPTSPTYRTDAALIALVFRALEWPCLLRTCTSRERDVLSLAVTGRSTYQLDELSHSDGPVAARLTRAQCADRLGMTENQYKRQLEQARHKVALVIAENLVVPSKAGRSGIR